MGLLCLYTSYMKCCITCCTILGVRVLLIYILQKLRLKDLVGVYLPQVRFPWGGSCEIANVSLCSIDDEEILTFPFTSFSRRIHRTK